MANAPRAEDLRRLIARCDSNTIRCFQGATTLCQTRSQFEITPEHLFYRLIDDTTGDVARIFETFKVEAGQIRKALQRVLDELPGGHRGKPALSPKLVELFQSSAVLATEFGFDQIRPGIVLLAFVLNPEHTRVGEFTPELDRIDVDQLRDHFHEIVLGASESAAAGPGAGPAGPMPEGAGALDRFTIDLTERAAAGEIDPVFGRDHEIRQMIDIFGRRRKNNPILVGEPGTGKTAIVEGLALRIHEGDVPPSLKGVRLISLDLGLLQAGASVKGEFENRLKNVIREIKSSETPIITFIDEAHVLIGAGGAAGGGDASNLLKPALARGTLLTVAATTWAEYKKHIEKDPALTRRFQVVQVNEPSEEKAILMMRGMASTMENYHRVQVLDEALESAVRLSHRYIPARQLPDKSVSLLDTACARVAISQHAVPAEVDDSRRRIEALETELEIIGREKTIGVETEVRKAEATEKLEAEKARLAGLEERWNSEKDLVTQILDIRAKLHGDSGTVEGTGSELEKAADDAATESSDESTEAAGESDNAVLSDAERENLLKELSGLQGKLREMQGETPLILPSVDEIAVGSVVQDWTGIPVGRMVRDELSTVLNLADEMEKRIIGQRHALEMIARRIQTSRASLDNPGKPIGVFMLAGTSGVGKTETALALAETLYGGEQNIITINMSEYQEAHTVSTLKGAPPGYVGYGEGGVLTEAVRRRPYSVVLLDEVEKAHPDVHEIFFQVFDKGWMEDGEGRIIDFKNTLILLTTNAGSDLIMNLCKDPELMPSPEGIAKALREPLLKVFPPALLGRLVTIPFYPLSDEMIVAIAKLQLGRIQSRILENHKIPFTYDDDVIDLIAERCTDLDSGGRMIDAILTNTVLPEISRVFLTRMMEGEPAEKVHVSVSDGEFSYAFD